MTKLVTIHCNPNGLDAIKELNLNWEYSPKYGKDEIDVIVKDIDYDPDSYIVDPDDQICDHYDINPDIDFDTKVKMPDGTEQEVTVPMTVRFFWPNASV